MMNIKQAFAVLSATFALSVCSPAFADNYDFTLDPGGDVPFSGIGLFTVDPTLLPESGTGAVAASFISFTLGGSSFGTSIGNYSVIADPNGPLGPPTPLFVYSATPPASILFRDFVPTGISYEEFHTCEYLYHCRPAEIVELEGSVFRAFIYPFGEAYIGDPGSIAITAAVPEPETYALMLAGLAACAFSVRVRRLAR
jgi:hypothetical protein